MTLYQIYRSEYSRLESDEQPYDHIRFISADTEAHAMLRFMKQENTRAVHNVFARKATNEIIREELSEVTDEEQRDIVFFLMIVIFFIFTAIAILIT